MSEFNEAIYNMLHDITVDLAAIREQNDKILAKVGGASTHPGVARASAQKCPLCGAAMRLKKGSRGLFLGCSSYPDCRGTLPVSQEDQASSPKAVDAHDQAKGRVYRLDRGNKGQSDLF